MKRSSYKKALRKLKSSLYPDYKLVRIGHGYTKQKRLPWVLFKAVGHSSYADMYKQFLIKEE